MLSKCYKAAVFYHLVDHTRSGLKDGDEYHLATDILKPKKVFNSRWIGNGLFDPDLAFLWIKVASLNSLFMVLSVVMLLVVHGAKKATSIVKGFLAAHSMWCERRWSEKQSEAESGSANANWPEVTGKLWHTGTQPHTVNWDQDIMHTSHSLAARSSERPLYSSTIQGKVLSQSKVSLSETLITNFSVHVHKPLSFIQRCSCECIRRDAVKVSWFLLLSITQHYTEYNESVVLRLDL